MVPQPVMATQMISYANMDSGQVLAARAAAQRVAQTTPSELNAFDIALLYDSDFNKAAKRIMDAIKDRGGEAAKQESNILDRFGDALQWMKASEQKARSLPTPILLPLLGQRHARRLP